jgi:hypothetical protein
MELWQFATLLLEMAIVDSQVHVRSLSKRVEAGPWSKSAFFMFFMCAKTD